MDPAATKLNNTWRYIALACFGLWLLLRWQHNFTEFAPTHDVVRIVCIVVAVLIGIAASCAYVWFSPESTTQTFLSAFGALLLATFAAFMITGETAGLLEGWIDFPAAQTSTYSGMLPIANAYKSDGRNGPTWHIETTPSVKMRITESDYDFILSNNGSFGFDLCVRVTMQRAGNAVRVMHSFFDTVPAGSIYRCPVNLETIP